MTAYDDDPLTQHIEARRKAMTTPRTAAGRTLLKALFGGRARDRGVFERYRDMTTAIEAEARADALDEVRAAVAATNGPALAAIDALREPKP